MSDRAISPRYDGHTESSENCFRYTGVSLFAGGGIGDIALRSSGVDVLVASELLDDRAEVFSANYPNTSLVVGDIRKNKKEIVKLATEKLDGRDLDVLFATPPCQGMSKNGRGKLLQGIRAGIKPSLDERNRLALEAVEIALALSPRVIVFENVPEMEYTMVDNGSGEAVEVLSIVRSLLASSYRGRWEVVEFADYGVPQRRQRLLSVFYRNDTVGYGAALTGSLMPPRTHSHVVCAGKKPWVTVSEALRGVPPLDSGSRETSSDPSIPLHRVPVLDRDKYFWIKNTPPGCSALDNQCANPSCGFKGNPTHRSSKGEDGVNRPKKGVTVLCQKCGELLPRPWVFENGNHRMMSAFHSAYKRMRADLPSSALTKNFSYACSDQKVHPTEHRVLSIHEALMIHTVAQYGFRWSNHNGKHFSDKTIREVIGESIPPLGLHVIFDHLLSMIGDAD